MNRHFSFPSPKAKYALHRLFGGAAVLLLVTLSMLAADPLAGYKSAATGTAGARVARFAVAAQKEAGQEENLTLNPANITQEYKFSVSNKTAQGINETATAYDVVVTFETPLEGVTLTLRNGRTICNCTRSADGKVCTFSNAGTFQAGVAEEHQLTLHFTMASNASGGTWENITVDVLAAQID